MRKLRFTNLKIAGDLKLKAEIFLCSSCKFYLPNHNALSNRGGITEGVDPRDRQQEHHETSCS